MKPDFCPTRRNILTQFGLLLAGATLGMPISAKGSSVDTSVPPVLARAIMRLVKNTSSATAIGEVYLAQYPDECSFRRLSLALLDGSFENIGRLEGKYLSERVRTDFELGNVVSLQGWILSRTEARLCALFAI